MKTTNPPLNRLYNQQSTRTSALDFLLALQAFLGQNQVDSIGPFQMRIESTKNNNWSLLIEGEASIIGGDTFDQTALGFPWPPTPPELNAPIYEMETTGAIRTASGTSSSLAAPTTMDGNDGEGSNLTQMIHLPSAALDFHSPIFTGSEESDILLYGMFDNTHASTVDNRNSPAEPLIVAHHCVTSEPHHCATPTLNAFQSSSTAGQKRGCLAHQATSSRRRASVAKKQKIKLDPSETESELIVRHLSYNMTCESYYEFLDSMLPRWIQWGIWHEHDEIVSNPKGTDLHSDTSPYSKLERAYRVVCHLNFRMGDDLVRDRVGLIQLHLEYTETHRGRRRSSGSDRTTSTVGRGDASHVIDCILENIHEGWEEMDQKRRAELRAKFHEKKKYGKRWFQAANALGPGILLICSTRLATAVRGTTVTAKMLDSAMDRFKLLDPTAMKTLEIIGPLAACLLKNDGYQSFEVVPIIRQLQSLSPETPWGPLDPHT
ncbi:uncharacterized protein BDV14DRAFT_195305 [Aspergillus stella-maris]|uniref:uncharacterized protein n=1 Tax=Aspergillus stella-maris TaxID=1810926 RepID=UPI003CCCEF31